MDGAPAFIDATSLILLIEADLTELVCENTSELHYIPSVVNYIREHASRFAQSPYQVGRIAFGKNYEVIPIPYDYQKELKIKNHILKAVELFEKYAKKQTEKVLSSKEEELEKKLPPYITDPYAGARARKYPIISEDCSVAKIKKMWD